MARFGFLLRTTGDLIILSCIPSIRCCLSEISASLLCSFIGNWSTSIDFCICMDSLKFFFSFCIVLISFIFDRSKKWLHVSSSFWRMCKKCWESMDMHLPVFEMHFRMVVERRLAITSSQPTRWPLPASMILWRVLYVFCPVNREWLWDGDYYCSDSSYLWFGGEMNLWIWVVSMLLFLKSFWTGSISLNLLFLFFALNISNSPSTIIWIFSMSCPWLKTIWFR